MSVRRPRSPWYVLARGLTTSKPVVHAAVIGPPYDDRLHTACGLSWPLDTQQVALTLPAHVSALNHCRRCWP